MNSVKILCLFILIRSIMQNLICLFQNGNKYFSMDNIGYLTFL